MLQERIYDINMRLLILFGNFEINEFIKKEKIQIKKNRNSLKYDLPVPLVHVQNHKTQSGHEKYFLGNL